MKTTLTLIVLAVVGSGACAPAGDSGAAQVTESATQPAQAAPAVEFVTSSLTEGLGLPFSEAARVGDILFISGMIGMRPGTLELVPGGLEAESRQTLENIAMILDAAGATRSDVFKCTVMLDDMSQWGAFNEIYAEFFGEHRPARSAFGADGLALGAALEVECMARAS